MQLKLRTRITLYYVALIVAVISLTVFIISLELRRTTTEQAELVAEELTRKATLTVNGYHDIVMNMLHDLLDDIRRYGVSIAHKTPIAPNIQRQQHESIVEFVQASLATADIDFVFIFGVDGTLQASAIGPTAHKPGDWKLPGSREIYEMFPMGRAAHDILAKETSFQISPHESLGMEDSPELHGFVGIDSSSLKSLGLWKDRHGGTGAIALASAGLVRDEFLIPSGLYIVGSLLDDCEQLFGQLYETSNIATFLFHGTDLVSTAGVREEARKEHEHHPGDSGSSSLAKVLERALPSNLVFPIAGATYSATCAPITDVEDARIGILCAGLPESVIAGSQASVLEKGRATQRTIQRWLLAVGVAMLMLTVVLARALAGRITGPLEKLVEFTGTVGHGDHSRRLRDNSPDEVGSLSRSIDTMLDNLFVAMRERERLDAKLRRGKKLEAVGTLAGGIAHDFNNLLMAILGNISLAAYDESLQESTRKLLARAEKASLRAADLTQQLLTFAKGGEPIREAASLEGVIRDSADFVLHGKNVACNYDIADDLWLVDIDKGQISQVIQNIALNSADAMQEGGVVEISCENVPDINKEVPQGRNGKYVRIRIMDSGKGIPGEIMDRIFDPYFTTKQLGNGLGLAITHSIVQKHDGYIEVSSPPGEGTSFAIYLPAAENQARPERPAPRKQLASSKARILLMDDEEMVRMVSETMLARLGCNVVLTADGEAAVEAYRNALDSGDPFDLVIMDLTVPGGMGGLEAAKRIHEIHTGARVVVASGYSTDPVMGNFEEYGFCGAIGKPFRVEEISGMISRVLR